ncbi:hypothetical protein [Glycomyces tarimensis]
MVAVPAHAQDEDAGGGSAICDLHDDRLRSPSGIVAAHDGDGWWIVPAGENQNETLSIIRVGSDCNVREAEESFIEHQPRDPQALAFDTDGFMWVADTGQALERDSIAITQLMQGDEANYAIYRYVFPQSPEEVEAFLVQPDEDYPLFFTSADGETTIYRGVGDNLAFDTPLENAGTVTLAEGGSVTGAALNADGSKAVLRTANAAYEYTVEGGDIVGALTGTEPVVTPLEDGGTPEDITYDADGNFVTLSSVDDGDGTVGRLTQYTPAAPAAEETSEAAAGDEAATEEAGPSLIDRILDLGFTTIIRILTAIAVVGFLVMLGGILVIRKSRRERAAGDDDKSEMNVAREESVFGEVRDDPPAPDPIDLGLDAGQPDPEVASIAKGSGAVYGASKAEPGGSVYGAKRPEATGSVYGAKPAAEPPGNVYGAAASPPPPAPKPEQAGPVYGGARAEPQYGAFEGAGQGSIYNDAAGSPPPPPPPPQVAPTQRPPAQPVGGTYGAPREPSGSVYGAQSSSPSPGGRVYGGNDERTPESDDDFWGPPEAGTYGRGR